MALPATRARADFQILVDNNPANQAATNQNLVIAATDTDFGPGSKSVINDPFVIQQFDPSNHTQVINGKLQTAQLYEVVVSLKYEFDNTIQMSFVKASTSTVTASGIMNLQMFDSHGNIMKDANGNPIIYALGKGGQPGFFTAKTLTFPTDTTNPNYIQPTPKVISSTSALGYFDSAVLNSFTGTGNVTLPVYAAASSSYTNSDGNGIGGSLTTASAALSVTYYYSFVPEPSSLALTGLGALGLCVVSRVGGRRRSVAAAA